MSLTAARVALILIELSLGFVAYAALVAAELAITALVRRIRARR